MTNGVIRIDLIESVWFRLSKLSTRARNTSPGTAQQRDERNGPFSPHLLQHQTLGLELTLGAQRQESRSISRSVQIFSRLSPCDALVVQICCACGWHVEIMSNHNFIALANEQALRLSGVSRRWTTEITVARPMHLKKSDVFQAVEKNGDKVSPRLGCEDGCDTPHACIDQGRCCNLRF